MAHTWRETFRNIKHSGIAGVLSIIIVALTIMVFNTLLIVSNYINAELNSLKKSPLVVVFLNDGLNNSEILNLQKKIENLPQVGSVKYISKEDALRRTHEMFPDRKEVLEGLEEMNPLPSSFEIEITPQFLDSVKDLADMVKGFPGVEDVQDAEVTSIFVRRVETIILIMGSILGLASIIIIFFSIILTAYMRRDEIKIMRLVGSTNSYIRLPLLLQGVIQGFTGSVLGLAIIYGLLYICDNLELPFIDISSTLFPSLEQIVLVVGIGTFIGFLGGSIPLRKYMRI